MGRTPDGLSGREREVLVLMARGLPDAEIGRRLGIARHTVSNHVARIFGKLRVHNRTEAAVYAAEHGLLPPTTKKAPKNE